MNVENTVDCLIGKAEKGRKKRINSRNSIFEQKSVENQPVLEVMLEVMSRITMVIP